MGDPKKKSEEVTAAAESTDKAEVVEPTEEKVDDQGTGPEGPETDLVAELKEERDQLLSENTGQADKIADLEAENEKLTENLEKANHTILSMKGMMKKKGVKETPDKIIRHE